MGGASRQTYASTLPPDRYYCLLDELPLHLIPGAATARLRGSEDRSEELSLNPECIFCRDGQFPDELLPRKDQLRQFALQGTVAWVRDPIGGSLLPFWLGPRLEAEVRELLANHRAASDFPLESRDLLWAAGILTSQNDRDHRRQAWEKAVATASLRFRTKGYAPLANLIHPFQVAALRRYYRYLIRTGRIPLGDEQSPRRYVAYNEPVARYFHHQIAEMLSAVAGEPVKPSYVYLASYLSGAELKKHTDRPQCEFSVTFCLDFSPEPALETPWPIKLDTPAGTVSVFQALGDGLAYRGTKVPHYRTALGEGLTSTSIFFHYVAADFAGSLD